MANFTFSFHTQRTPLSLGELLLVLSYNLMTHQIIVKIIEATRLPKWSVTGNPSKCQQLVIFFYKENASILMITGVRVNAMLLSKLRKKNEPSDIFLLR